MSDPQKNKPWKEDYPTAQGPQFVVTITGVSPYGEREDGAKLVGGAVIGPFNSRDETMEFIHWLETTHPRAAEISIMGSAQLLSEADFKQAVSDSIEKKELMRRMGNLHS